MTLAHNKVKSFLVLLAFLFISVAIFEPSFHRGFVSDDYCILDFLFNNKGYLVGGFFRPLGDLTLKWTYLLGGANPFNFYTINALLHGFNAWLVYIFCERIAEGEQKKIFAVAAAVMFLFYHSVGEVVLWTIGRGVSLAVTFSLCAMIAFVGRINSLLKYVTVCACYFVALCAYESVLLLPIVLLLFAKAYRLSVSYFYWSAALLFTLATNLVLRVVLTGKLWAAYKGVVWAKNPVEYASSWIKSLFRLFVPAFNQPVLFTAVALIMIGVLAFLVLRRKSSFYNKKIVTLAVTGIITALSIVMFYGASTRNSEGDRLLYWPAVFASMLVAIGLMQIASQVRRYAVLVFLAGMQLYFIKNTQGNWIEADQMSKTIITQIAERKERPLYVINLPSQHKGAFMFRNCFDEALRFHGVDPSGVRVVNQLEFSAIEAWDGSVVINDSMSRVEVWPTTRVEFDAYKITKIESAGKVIASGDINLQNVAYWNKDSLVFLGLR